MINLIDSRHDLLTIVDYNCTQLGSHICSWLKKYIIMQFIIIRTMTILYLLIHEVHLK